MPNSDSLGLSLLARHSLIYGAALVIDRLIGFLLLPILTTGLDQASYGAWAQIIATFAWLSNLLEFGFYHSIMRFIAGRERATVSRVLHGMLAILALNSVVFVGLACAIPGLLSQLVFATTAFSGIIPLIALFIVSECLFEFLGIAFLRADGRIAICSAYYVIKNVLRFALLWQGTSAGADLGGLLLRLTVGNGVLVCVVYAVNVAPTVEIAARGLGRPFWRGVIGYSSGIVASGSLAWANAMLNRFLIVHFLGLAALATYAANFSIASVAGAVSLVLTFTVTPLLNAAWGRGDKDEVRRLLETASKFYLYATVPAAICIGLCYLPIVHLFTAPQYVTSPGVIWLLLATVVLFGFEQLLSFATILDSPRFNVWTRSAALVLNLGLCWVLLTKLGILAAVIAALAATLTVIALSVLFLQRDIQYSLPFGTILRIGIAGVAMAGAGWTTGNLFGGGLPGIIATCAVGVIVYVAIEAIGSGSTTRALLTMTRGGLLRSMKNFA